VRPCRECSSMHALGRQVHIMCQLCHFSGLQCPSAVASTEQEWQYHAIMCRLWSQTPPERGVKPSTSAINKLEMPVVEGGADMALLRVVRLEICLLFAR
jgi:hypothetical protein